MKTNLNKLWTIKEAAEYCKAANKHKLKFHHERAGKSIYYIKEIV